MSFTLSWPKHQVPCDCTCMPTTKGHVLAPDNINCYRMHSSDAHVQTLPWPGAAAVTATPCRRVLFLKCLSLIDTSGLLAKKSLPPGFAAVQTAPRHLGSSTETVSGSICCSSTHRWQRTTRVYAMHHTVHANGSNQLLLLSTQRTAANTTRSKQSGPILLCSIPAGSQTPRQLTDHTLD
jgi:hypothetical protein